MNDQTSSPPPPDTTQPAGLPFLAGGGEMGALMRAHDWSASPLGDPAGWPQSLRAVAGLLLNSKFPMFVAWGEELGFLYNDPYAEILGAKHPRALGSRFYDIWSEIWPDISPLIDAAMAGEATYRENLPLTMNRKGFDEQTWFTFSYSPVLDESGTPAGVLAIVVETTEGVLAERALRESEARLRFMSGLDEALRDSRDAPAAMRAAAEHLARRLGASRCAYADVDADSDRFFIRDDYTAPGVASSAGTYSLDLFRPRAVAKMRGGRTLVVRDVAGELAPGEGREMFLSIGISAIVCCPLVKDGRLVAMMAVHQDAPRDWQADELALVETVVERCWAHVQRVGAEARLRESEHELQLLTDNLPVLVSYFDADERYHFVNRVYERWFPRKREEIIGKRLRDVVGDAAYAGVKQYIDRALAGEQLTFEQFMPYKEGGYRHIRVEYVPRVAADGRVEGIYALVEDVTKRKQAEAELRESEARLKLVQAAGGIGSFDYDLQKDDAICSPEYYQLFGLPHGYPINRETWPAAIHPDDRHKAVEALDRAIAERQPFDYEYRIIRADNGEVRWLSGRAAIIFDDKDQPWRYVGGNIDVTERRSAEERLRESEARYRTLFGAIEAGFCIVEVKLDAKGARTDYRVVEANPAFYRQTGFPETIFGQWLREAAPALEEHWYEIYGRVCRTGESERFEQGSDMLGRWFDVYAFPTGEPDECRVGILFNDISARRKAEAELRELNETLEQRVAEKTAERNQIWNLSRDPLLIADAQGVWLSVSPAWTSILGWRPDELIGRTSEWMEHPDDRSRTREEVAHLAGGQPTLRFENRFRAKDGIYHWFSWTAVPEGDRLFAVARDITAEKERAAELEEAQEALRQSQKMEAVGQLTGGVAHDFNNLLQIVTGNLDILQRNLPEDAARLRRAAANAMTGATRAASLTQRLLAFSRRQPLDPKPISLNRLVTDMSELLGRTIGEAIEVETILAGGLWQVEVDPNQLESAILNLAINARDAMPDGGKLTIETSNTHLDHAYAASNVGVSPGQYVVICVSDTGAGMSEETIARAFEPFFTTKDVGRGTGLGLSQVYGFVKQSNGHVKIYSEVGEGTTVKIYMPRLLREVAEEKSLFGHMAPEGSGSETILVVEDDDDVRAYSVEVLRDLGYRVLEAHDGPSALSLLGRQDAGVDLLFSDVVLPGGMTGAVIAEKARMAVPGLKVLFTTGYARNAIVHQGRLDPGVHLLTKPFTYEELAVRVRDILDGQG